MVTSVCTGALTLGAGRLEGRRATTHWALLDELFRHGAIPTAGRFVVDGSLITPAGVSAGIDMALWLTGRLAGDDVARMIQLAIEYGPEPPYRSGVVAEAGPMLAERTRRLLQRAFGPPIDTAAGTDHPAG